MKKLLIITTNYSGEFCPEGQKCIKDTGVYLEEFAVPYLIFEKSNIDMTVASISGKVSPIDESSMSCSNPVEWDKCIKILRNTKRIYDVDYKTYDGIYFPGGHGPLFDITDNKKIKEIVEHFFNEGKLVAAICHGVCALLNAQNPEGYSFIKSKKLTSFTNEEEKIAKMTELVPFSLEDRLIELGADYIKAKPWSEHVVADRNLITGQNQNSATLLAEKILDFMR